jgi:hypothetical protein
MAPTISKELDLFITKHAQTRMQQRSFSESDLSTIARCGTVINDQEILLTKKDVERETSRIRDQIKLLQRCAGKARVKICGTQMKNGISENSTDIVNLRQQVINLERLRNRKIVLNGNRVVTCYHCTKCELKRISRIFN